MIDNLDVDRIITERITLQHSRLIHRLIEEAANEMKDIINENRDLQYVKIWSNKKTKELNSSNESHIELHRLVISKIKKGYKNTLEE